MKAVQKSCPFAPRTIVLAAILLLMLLLSATPVAAEDITVSGDCSLAEAIENANDGAQTNGDCASGNSGADTITLTGPVALTGGGLEISDTLTINGGGNTLSGSSALLVARGKLQPDSSRAPFTLTINNLVLTNNNSTTATDAALELFHGAETFINDSTFRKNSAKAAGGPYLSGLVPANSRSRIVLSARTQQSPAAPRFPALRILLLKSATAPSRTT